MLDTSSGDEIGALHLSEAERRLIQELDDTPRSIAQEDASQSSTTSTFGTSAAGTSGKTVSAKRTAAAVKTTNAPSKPSESTRPIIAATSYSSEIISAELDNLAQVSKLRDENAVLRAKLKEKDSEVNELADALMALKDELESLKTQPTVDAMKNMIRQNRELQRAVAREKGLVATITQERDRLRSELAQYTGGGNLSSGNPAGTQKPRAASASVSTSGLNGSRSRANLAGANQNQEGDDATELDSMRKRLAAETQRAARLGQQVSLLQAEITKYRAILIRELGPPPKGHQNQVSTTSVPGGSAQTANTNTASMSGLPSTSTSTVGDGDSTLNAVLAAFQVADNNAPGSTPPQLPTTTTTQPAHTESQQQTNSSSSWPWTWEALAEYTREQNGWRGRAEIIASLKQKLREAQQELKQLQQRVAANASASLESSPEQHVTGAAQLNRPSSHHPYTSRHGDGLPGVPPRTPSALAAAGANALVLGSSQSQGVQVQRLQQENEALRSDLHAMREKSKMLKSRVDAQSREIQELRGNLETLLQKCDADDALIDALTTANKQLENKLVSADVINHQQLSKQLQETVGELRTKEKEVSDMSQEITRLKGEIEKLKLIRTVFVKNHVKAWMLEEGQRARDLIEQELQLAKQANKTLSSKLDALTAQYQEVATECINAKARIKTLERRLAGREGAKFQEGGANEGKVGTKEQLEALVSEKLLISQALTDTLHRKDEQVEELTSRLENERVFHRRSIESLQARIDAIIAAVSATGFYYQPQTSAAATTGSSTSLNERQSTNGTPDAARPVMSLGSTDQSRLPPVTPSQSSLNLAAESTPEATAGGSVGPLPSPSQPEQLQIQQEAAAQTRPVSAQRGASMVRATIQTTRPVVPRAPENEELPETAETGSTSKWKPGPKAQRADEPLAPVTSSSIASPATAASAAVTPTQEQPGVGYVKPIKTEVDVAKMVELLMQQDF